MRSVMAGIVADDAPVTDIWSREAFCALGHGDLDVDAILDGLRGISFGGWLVVEQDILPRSAERFARAARGAAAQPRVSRRTGALTCRRPSGSG